MRSRPPRPLAPPRKAQFATPAAAGSVTATRTIDAMEAARLPDRSTVPAVNHLRPVPDPKPPAAPIEGEPASIEELERWATVLRIDCVRMLAVAKSGHLDSSLSSADILTALYHRVLKHDPKNPEWPARDRFVLSKGHAAPIQYAALARHGYFPLEDLMGLRKIGAQLQGHPDMNKTPGVEVSTGSLGQGLSMSLGIALALRLDGLDDSHVFCVLSDGDCQEGQTWEAATALHTSRPPTSPRSSTTTTCRPTAPPRRSWTSGTWPPSSPPSAGTRSRSTATTWAPSSRRSSAAAASTARRRSSRRRPGQGRLDHGGPLRLPRQGRRQPRVRG